LTLCDKERRVAITVAKNALRVSNGGKEMRARIQRAIDALDQIGVQISALETKRQEEEMELDPKARIFERQKESQKRKNRKPWN
jgi:hypothetical protein